MDSDWINSAVELRRTLRMIGAKLHTYRNLIGNLGSDLPASVIDRRKPAEQDFRELARELRTQAKALPCYWVLSVMRTAPRRSHIYEASGLLTRLSNLISSWKEDDVFLANRDAEEIKRLLGLSFNRKALSTWNKTAERRGL